MITRASSPRSGSALRPTGEATTSGGCLSGTVQLEGAVVTVTGEIDISTVRFLQGLLDQAGTVGTGAVTVNLAGVVFMDARGLSALVHTAGQLAQTGRPLVVLAPAKLERLFALTGLTQSLGVRPTAATERTISGASLAAGTLDLDASALPPSNEDAEHAALLQRAVDTLAGRDSRLFRRLLQAQQQHGYRDALTGALQRDAGREQLRRAVDQAHRTDQPLTLVFLDVDHLKQTNDTQGHAAGDLLLQALGAALRQSLRSYDVVVRYGGDEFVCALPDAGLTQATGRVDDVAKRLEAAVRGASVSVGFAVLRPEDSLDDVVRRADQNMYDHRRHHRSVEAD